MVHIKKKKKFNVKNSYRFIVTIGRFVVRLGRRKLALCESIVNYFLSHVYINTIHNNGSEYIENLEIEKNKIPK